jgi:vacuolar-type H+-ATPase subunit E/Vma4
MSLEAILDAIRASGQKKVDEVELGAQVESEAVLAKARQEAEKARRDAWQRSVMPAYRERARIIHRARLDQLRTVGDAREAAIDATLVRARQCLEQLRTIPAYPAVLCCLTNQALAELQGSLEESGRARLEVDPRDKVIVAKILDELGLGLCVSYQLECWGGLVARSEDGCIVVINTLESRLEKATPFLRQYLAALFEQGDTVRTATIMETLVSER